MVGSALSLVIEGAPPFSWITNVLVMGAAVPLAIGLAVLTSARRSTDSRRWRKLVEAERAGSLMIDGQSAASPQESAETR
jgi:hypothetical protein